MLLPRYDYENLGKSSIHQRTIERHG
jgi:hypothetical protein